MNNLIASMNEAIFDAVEYISMVGGLTTDITLVDGDETKKVPAVANHLNRMGFEPCFVEEYASVLPDDAQSVILFWSDARATKVRDLAGTGSIEEAAMSLNVWYNRRRLDVDFNLDASYEIERDLRTVIKSRAKTTRVALLEFTRNHEAGIYASYSTKEKELQHLIFPYGGFVVRVKFRYVVENDCEGQSITIRSAVC